MTSPGAVGTAPTDTSLTITLFGAMQVLVTGQPLPRLRSRKALWLLALVALRVGRPVEREWLAETLWPDADTDQALANLRTALSELRQALGTAAGQLRSPSRHALCLEPGGTVVDVADFDGAIAAKTPAALARAVRLYQGPLLEGCSEEWVGQERGAREQDCLRALLSLADNSLAAGDWVAASDFYRRAAVLDPWRDAARRGLMESLARGGDINSALQVYREFTTLLRDDPKAAPDAQTSTLYARLRTEARRQSDGSAPPPVTAPKADRGVMGYLPHPLTDIVGRDDECLEVTVRLRRSRLVTLTGSGGIGKTRLALSVAAEVAPEYADGVWLVSLEALSDGDLIAEHVGRVLGMQGAARRSPLESLTNHLRSRLLLLVLDNCEHLLEASAQVVRHLLRECAGVRVLATSREPLGITGEAAWAVPALAVPVPEHLPTGQATLLRVLMSYEGIQLFVERAIAAQNTFALTGSNARVVAEVCARLEGIPLALELAAARARAMTVAQIAARLDDHLGLLTTGSHTMPSRQQTLRATLDWSYGLLGEAERQLLARLSVFAGGWTLEAAEAVCAGSLIQARQVMNLLASLVDKSLVHFEARDDAAAGRYRLLETVRQYAVERLEESGKTATVRTAHRDFFLTLAEGAETLLTGAAQQTLMACLEAEQENLRAALGWCGAEPLGVGAGLRLAGALWEFWEMRGQYSEGRAFLTEALGRPGAELRTLGRAKALNAVGVLASYQGDKEAIQEQHTEALAIFREVGDLEGVAWSLYNLGNIAAVGAADSETARTLYDESLALFRELGNNRGIASTLHQVGSLASKWGDKEIARTLYTESLAIFQEMGNRQATAWSLNDLGSLTWEQGDYATARELHEESLAVFRELGHKRGIGWALHLLGKLARQQGDYAAAGALYAESLAISREMADRQGIAWLLNDLGNVAILRADPETARTLYAESLAISRGLADRQGVAWSLHHLGSLAREQGDYAAARERHEESLTVFREVADRQAVAWSLNDLGRLFEAQGDHAAARARHAESLAIFQGLGNKQGVAWTLHYQSRAAFNQGDLAAARSLYAAGASVQGELRDWGAVAESLEGLAAVMWAQSASQRAVRLWAAAHQLREHTGIPLTHTPAAQAIEQARATLGESSFTVAWQEGIALTWEQAVADASDNVASAEPETEGMF
jgi:predicted ATPase/DNA-binding SARP family transcriptional activator